MDRESGKYGSALEFYNESIEILQNAIPPCDCGCRDALVSAISNVKEHPHWILMAHSFLFNAEQGRSFALDEME